MAPKRATRSAARAGKDEEPKKQISLEDSISKTDDTEGGDETKTGKEREAPVDLTEDADSDGKTKGDQKNGSSSSSKDSSKTGEKRNAPVDLTGDSGNGGSREGDDASTSKKDDKEEASSPPSKKARVDPPRHANDEQKAEADAGKVLKDPTKTVDEQSEEAKQAGRDIQESVDVMKPSRGTLESGHLYFLYKPKVETEDPQSIDDIAKFHTLLLPSPSGNGSQTKYRLITAGRKHLPASRDDGGHETEWGLISGVGEDLSDLKATLGASSYETKTRGTRHQPASRVAAHGHYILHSPEEGEGIKDIEKTDENRPQDFPVHLAYSIALPLPEEFGDVQKDLDIKAKGSFAIQVKNPDAPSSNPRAFGVSKDRQKDYPDELRGLFTTRWIPANPVALLDYPGQELLLISGRDHLPDGGEEEVNKEAGAEIEDVKKAEKKGIDEEEVIFKSAFAELEMYKSKKDVPGIEALEGHWA